jgi:NADH-quinone oxidoreductase subunit M
LIFGIIYDRTHTRQLSEYGGLATRNAWLATAFVFSVMASIGLPGLPGFVGEFLVLSGSFFRFPAAALVATLGVLFGAVYMLSLTRRMIFGPEGPTVSSHEIKLSWNEWVSIVPLIVGMLYLGLHPQFILNQAEKAITIAISGLR